MLQHKHELCPEKGTDAWRRLVLIIARRRVLVEPRMLVRSPRFGVRVLQKILLMIAYSGRRL
jgi:hypothetical protein